jgi:serine-type D-Ala-D-Ala carboxypeptidase (penicillin-binding protein 5/6)
MAKSCHHKLLRLLAVLLAFTTAPLHAAPKKAVVAKPSSAKPKSTLVAKASPAPLAPGELLLVAKAAALVDVQSGQFLYQKNPDEIHYPASTTKILTALVVIESGDLDKMVPVDIEDTKVEPSALYIKPGEQFPRRHLLYALLLKSANDVAMCLARDNAGSVAAFAEKMTARAAKLGAVNSHFTNPHGLHDPHHFTTAHDLAKISLEAMKNPVFREIVATPEAWLLKGEQFVQLRNHNKLLWRLPGCTGLKTGFTRAAQQTLVSSAMRDGHEVISVVLRTNNPGIWTDSTTLLLYGFEKLGLPPPAVPAVPSAPSVPK